ncbi:hypothetical protein HDA32_003612 [Spinactinospora alkalitolerans]|uniref:Uncharacterized protein n=1 Tax=Spinactinospora alkalitolerans TaxID=687207 RepID=A0A852TZL1_9ACTN|nr:hypothetical protein [Spinactinospora alkalitolerans]NYE48492.1 hypothetical protein [Spinactinospora alkalitolerans]
MGPSKWWSPRGDAALRAELDASRPVRELLREVADEPVPTVRSTSAWPKTSPACRRGAASPSEQTLIAQAISRGRGPSTPPRPGRRFHGAGHVRDRRRRVSAG